jgi:hypothetical protein
LKSDAGTVAKTYVSGWIVISRPKSRASRDVSPEVEGTPLAGGATAAAGGVVFVEEDSVIDIVVAGGDLCSIWPGPVIQ